MNSEEAAGGRGLFRMKTMKVMVFTPTWETETGTAMRPETEASARGQRFGGELVWEIGLENPHPNQSHRNVLAQYQAGRERFLASDCDALVTFEHDMTMPADAVQRLWDVTGGRRDGGDPGEPGVAYGVYLLRHGSWVLNAWEYIGGRNLGESLTIHPEKLRQARRQGTVRVSGCGFGCTLMRRAVVERFEFHKGDDEQWCPDIPFAVDCLRANIMSVALMDVACDHYDGGRWLRPYGGAMAMKLLARQSVTVYDGQSLRRFEAGKTYEVNGGPVEEWVRAGYVEPITNGEGEVEAATMVGAEETAVMRKARRRGGEL